MHITTGVAAAAAHRRRDRAAASSRRSGPSRPSSSATRCSPRSRSAHFEKNNELDLSFGVKGLSRFRANIFMQRGAVAGAFRAIPFKILTLRGARAAAGRRGVREQAARARARHRADRLRQVDDARGDHRQDQRRAAPAHHDDRRSDRVPAPAQALRSSTSARSAPTPRAFKSALKYVLRQDPDVVLVGEMRDLETIEAALTISETGHLVFATLHTNSAVSTINRIIDVFPPHQQAQIRAQALVRAPGRRLAAAPAARTARRAACSRSRC